MVELKGEGVSYIWVMGENTKVWGRQNEDKEPRLTLRGHSSTLALCTLYTSDHKFLIFPLLPARSKVEQLISPPLLASSLFGG